MNNEIGQKHCQVSREQLKANILFPAYSHTRGLMYHLSKHAIMLYSQASRAGYAVHIVSPAVEYLPGLWDSVRQHFAPEHVRILENEGGALETLAERMLQSDDLPLVAHLHGVQQLLAFRRIKKKYPERVKIIYEVHSYRNASWRRIPYGLVTGRLLKRYVDFTIFLAPNAASRFPLSGKLFRCGRAGIIPKGVEPWTPEMLEKPPVDRIDKEFVQQMEQEDTFKFLYLARFVPGKGHLWLAKAMIPVLRRHAKARLVLAGGFRKGVIAAKVRSLVSTEGVASQVICPEEIPCDYVPWLVHKCNVGIVPSRSETFGLNYLEPMLAGKPIIATRCGLAEWVVQDYLTGLGVEYGDEKGLARAAEFMISHPNETAAMGQRAQDLTRSIFTWERATKAHVQIYDSILGEKI